MGLRLLTIYFPHVTQPYLQFWPGHEHEDTSKSESSQRACSSALLFMLEEELRWWHTYKR